MWYRIQRTIACLAAIIGLTLGTATAEAGWGHRWGHHHHFYGGYYGWGIPSYGYSSFSLSIGRPRLFHPYYSVGYYNYYAPSYISAYSISMPSYYYATPTYYVAPTYYASPIIYPSSCCDPCSVSSVLAPNSSITDPQYSTGIAPAPSPQVASMMGGSFVDRMLGRATSPTSVPLKAADVAVAISRSNDGSVRTVSTLKPVASSASTSNIDQLTAIPSALLTAADEIFAAGGYQDAVGAYARLAVRYGNHDELAVRRFIALVASGDHSQASIVYELAVASGHPLKVELLPAGGLARLYGPNATLRKNHIESLASYALRSSDEALPLAMVGTWLQLDGQSQRAAPFLERAEMIERGEKPTTAPALANRLADRPLAR